MRGIVVGALCAVSGTAYPTESFATISSYQDCVQECRDNLPPGETLQRCMLEKGCANLPRLRWTYDDCVKRCEERIRDTEHTLQQCIARFVCTQYPRD